MSQREELITAYLDKCGIKRKWKGYRFLYLAISRLMEDSSLDCNSICELICLEYDDVCPRTVYTSSSYAIKQSALKGETVYQFISDAAMDCKRNT